MANSRLYVVSRESIVETRHLLEVDPRASVLLVGRGLMLPADLFGKRNVYAIEGEVEELGLKGKLSPAVKVVPAGEMIDIILANQVLNFS